MSSIFDLILYRPMLNVLVYFYNTIAFGDLGISIILLTLLIRLILYPFFEKNAYNQTIMQMIQPKVKEIQDKHKHDKQKQTEELLKLYKEHKVNPFYTFLFLLIQLPILIILYKLILNSFSTQFFNELYPFIVRPNNFQTYFLGLINLKNRSILLVVLAAAFQYLAGYLALPKINKEKELLPAEKVARQMVFISPLLTIFIFFNFPAAISLYWLASSVFSVFQQIIINQRIHGQFKINNSKNS